MKYTLHVFLWCMFIVGIPVMFVLGFLMILVWSVLLIIPPMRRRLMGDFLEGKLFQQTSSHASL